jgi:methylamine utilization protein MauE
VPLGIVVWMARILPWIEVAVGALLIVGIGVRWAALFVTGLLVMFMIALTHAALGGLEINCGCFGNNSVKPSHELILDSGLLAVALAVTVGGFFSRSAGKSQA